MVCFVVKTIACFLITLIGRDEITIHPLPLSLLASLNLASYICPVFFSDYLELPNIRTAEHTHIHHPSTQEAKELQALLSLKLDSEKEALSDVLNWKNPRFFYNVTHL